MCADRKVCFCRFMCLRLVPNCFEVLFFVLFPFSIKLFHLCFLLREGGNRCFLDDFLFLGIGEEILFF